MVVYGRACGLHHENVRAADAFLYGNAYLAVGKRYYLGFAQRETKLLRYLLCDLGVGVGCENFDILAVKFYSDSTKKMYKKSSKGLRV